MPVAIEAYTTGGIVRGVIPRADRLRDALDGVAPVEIMGTTVALAGGSAGGAGPMLVHRTTC